MTQLRSTRAGHGSSPADDSVTGAEKVILTLAGLAKRTAADPKAPFQAAVLDELLVLKKSDRGAFESLRADLKAAGCRVTALDEAIALLPGGRNGSRPSQADTLIRIAEDASLFHAADGMAYADLEVDYHRETWPVRTKGFRRWLTRRYFEECNGAPGSEALQAALNVIEAKAHYGAPEIEVHLRVGKLGGRLYLDLADAEWRAVEVDASGWRVVDRPPVRFRRVAGMKSLPVPVRGGSIATLRSFLNLHSDTDFVLVVAWLLACLRNVGPYPILALSGEQGSAKSTFSAILRSLIDPNTAPLRALPREDRDLFIAANNGHVIAFDNISSLSPWLSDTLCRLATGGGFAVRQLYTDQDEVLFDAARPILLNGIEDIVTRQDLADRAIFLSLVSIPEDRRRPEAELWDAFRAAQPKLLGALLDAVVEGIRRHPSIHLDRLPRMADFALWATACETAMWPAGTFREAYQGNRDVAVDNVIEADPVGMAIRHLMREKDEWSGTATELLGVLARTVGDEVSKAKGWPGTSQLLSGRVSRAAPFLRRLGIIVDRVKIGRSRTRVIRITVDSPGEWESRGNPSSASSANPEEARMFNERHLQTMDGWADDGRCPPIENIVPVEVDETAAVNDADDTDDDCTAISGAEDEGNPDPAGGEFYALYARSSADHRVGLDADDDLEIPDFLNRARNPRPGDPNWRRPD